MFSILIKRSGNSRHSERGWLPRWEVGSALPVACRENSIVVWIKTVWLLHPIFVTQLQALKMFHKLLLHTYEVLTVENKESIRERTICIEIKRGQIRKKSNRTTRFLFEQEMNAEEGLSVKMCTVIPILTILTNSSQHTWNTQKWFLKICGSSQWSESTFISFKYREEMWNQ